MTKYHVEETIYKLRRKRFDHYILGHVTRSDRSIYCLVVIDDEFARLRGTS